MSEAAELDALIQAPARIEVAGETLEIWPLVVIQIPAILRAARPVVEALRRGESDILGLLADHGDRLLEAVAIATGRTRAWVDALPADDLVRLAGVVVEVNADFFVRRLLPAITAAAEQAARALEAAGRIPASG